MVKPWIAVLHKACAWAKGESDAVGAASRVTENVFSSPQFAYDTSHGRTNYAQGGVFDCKRYLERFNGGIGLGQMVNCTDCATIVTTFANALGCKLWESQMGYHFQCNEIIPIGHGSWQVPFGWGFSYHEVAWTGGCDDADPLFDACLKVDADTDPTTAPHTHALPKNIVFYRVGETQYKERLAAPAGRPNCLTKPSTKIRRPVV